MEELIIKRLKAEFWTLAAVIIIVAFLFGSGTADCLTAVSLASGVNYAVELLSVLLVIISVPLAIKQIPDKIERLGGGDKEKALAAYRRMNSRRLELLFAVTIAEAAIYHCLQNQSALYCAYISGLVFIYCFPTRKSLNAFLNRE